MRVERVFRLLGLLLGLIAGVEYASFIISEAKIDGYTLRAIGLMLTALAGALCGVFPATLPWHLGFVISLIVALVFAYWGLTLGLSRRHEMMALVLGPARAAGVFPTKTVDSGVLLDTSVIIDGRIMDIAQTGFLRDKILVPHFVLAELQYIADSSDALRRNRGRRGLEVLNLLQKEPLVDIEFIGEDVPDVTEVDMKLIKLANKRKAAIMTNDYNLNQIG